MIRRAHTPALRAGEIELDAQSSHHVRDVLRLRVGDLLELFDDAGMVAHAPILRLNPVVVVKVNRIEARPATALELTIGSAIPKGDRADWMIEKLSELGVSRFIPLHAARSIVLPQGINKRHRWERLANESAKQSRRPGIMRIDPMTTVEELLHSLDLAPPDSAISVPTPGSERQRTPGSEYQTAFFLSTDPGAQPIIQAVSSLGERRLILLIGPEGGWTDQEMERFAQSDIEGLRLTETVLRIETAAVASAAVVLCSEAAAFNPHRES